jgi:hypothetical protein
MLKALLNSSQVPRRSAICLANWRWPQRVHVHPFTVHPCSAVESAEGACGGGGARGGGDGAACAGAVACAGPGAVVVADAAEECDGGTPRGRTRLVLNSDQSKLEVVGAVVVCGEAACASGGCTTLLEPGRLEWLAGKGQPGGFGTVAFARRRARGGDCVHGGEGLCAGGGFGGAFGGAFGAGGAFAAGGAFPYNSYYESLCYPAKRLLNGFDLFLAVFEWFLNGFERF